MGGPNNEFSMRRIGIDELVKDVNGKAIPDDDDLDWHLVGILDEVEQATSVVGHKNFQKKNDGEAGRIHYDFSGSQVGYKITYDPTTKLTEHDPDPASGRTSAFLHEIMHVVCHRQYEKPSAFADELYGRNFHIPLSADEKAVGASLRAQLGIADKNYSMAAGKLDKDSSKIITSDMRKHLIERIGYGQRMPDVHYDSVLFELLVYMTLQKAQETPTFKCLKSLSVEASERRAESPGRPIVQVVV